MKLRDMQLYAMLAAALGRSGGRYPQQRQTLGPPSTGGKKRFGRSEVAHLSKKERLKRRRTYRLSTRKR